MEIYHEKVKIYSQSMGGGNYTQVPTILLKGKWLEEAGFQCGEYVEVKVEGDKISLTKTTFERITESSIEEKIKKLDKKQLKELNDYLDGLNK